MSLGCGEGVEKVLLDFVKGIGQCFQHASGYLLAGEVHLTEVNMNILNVFVNGENQTVNWS